MRACVALGVGLALAGCASTARIAATPAHYTAAAASCAGLSPAEQFASARLVFVGVMLPGPTTPLGHRRVLGSPARMRVERYLKGRGPRVVRVDTAVTIERDATGIAEDGIEPRAGERWKIYARSRHEPFAASICIGSALVRHHATASPVLVSPTDGGAVPVTSAR
jgi:hypothetical protein